MTGEPPVANEISGQVIGPVIQAARIDQLQIFQTGLATACPAQLPAAPRHFAGRSEEMDRIESGFGEGAAGQEPLHIFVISGPGGIGKTALALRYGHQSLGRYPDGQLYVNLRGFDDASEPLGAAEALRGFLTALGAEPPQIPAALAERAAMFRSITSPKRILVVLDNAADSAQVQPLLPGGDRSVTLVTSRRPLSSLVSQGAAFMRLGYLSADTAADVLSLRIGDDRTAAEPGSVADLIDSCAGLPLALSVVAARAAMQPSFPLSAISEELHTEAERLDVLSAGGETSSVRSVFSWSYRRLSKPAQRAFRLISVSRGPDLGLPAAARLISTSSPSAGALLRELVDLNLAEEYRPRRYRLHDLLRLYSLSLLDECDGRPAEVSALSRLLDYYLWGGFAATNLLIGDVPLVNSPARPILDRSEVPPEIVRELQTRADAVGWFDAEDTNLLAAIRQAVADEVGDYWFQLPLVIDNAWVWRGRLQDVLEIWKLAAVVADRRGNTEALAHSARFLSMAHMRFGQNDEAVVHLTKAVAAYAAMDDPVGQASALVNLATVEHRRGRDQKASALAGQALGLFSEAGSRSGAAHALNLLAGIQSAAGERGDAITACHRALDIFRELGDEDGEGDALDQLGVVQSGAGEHADAIKSFEQAVVCYRRAGDEFGEGDATFNLARSLTVLRGIEFATATYDRAAQLFARQGRAHKAQAVAEELARNTASSPHAQE